MRGVVAIWLGLFLVVLPIAPAWASAQIDSCNSVSDVYAYCGIYEGEQNRQLAIEIVAFDTEAEAAEQVEAWLITHLQFYKEVPSDRVFGASQVVLAANTAGTIESNMAMVLFVQGTTVNKWYISGEQQGPVEIMHDLYETLPKGAPSGSTLPQMIGTMIPESDDLETFGYKVSLQYNSPAVIDTGDLQGVDGGDSWGTAKPTPVPTKPARSTVPVVEPTVATSIPSTTSAQTLEVMNNQPEYQNRRVSLRGQVYIIDVINDQTALVITDGETYFFNVVYDGALPGIRVGDIVEISGVPLDRTLQGSPLVRADSVVVD